MARALGVSHGTVYRHFPTKVALREAVAWRWIDRSHPALADLAADPSSAPPRRLRSWLSTMFAEKQAAALEDPELFATYVDLAQKHSAVVTEHIEELVGQLR